MKRIFVLLLATGFIFTGCESSTVQTDEGNSFLDDQINQAKKELEQKRLGNEKLFGPAYDKAMKFSAACNKATGAINAATDMQGVKDALSELRTQTAGLVLNEEAIESYANKEIDFLISKASPANKSMIVDQIRLIEYGYLVHFNEVQTNHSFLVDYLEPYLLDTVGTAGASFSTEIVFASYSSTRNNQVRIGEGRDADKKLTGKIETLGYSEKGNPVYTRSNTKPGKYDIPAELIVPTASGRDAVLPFTIHYEIR